MRKGGSERVREGGRARVGGGLVGTDRHTDTDRQTSHKLPVLAITILPAELLFPQGKLASVSFVAFFYSFEIFHTTIRIKNKGVRL